MRLSDEQKIKMFDILIDEMMNDTVSNITCVFARETDKGMQMVVHTTDPLGAAKLLDMSYIYVDTYLMPVHDPE